MSKIMLRPYPNFRAQVLCFFGALFFFDTTLVTYFFSGYFTLCQK